MSNQQQLYLVRPTSIKGGASQLTVGTNTPAQAPLNQTEAELAWSEKADFNFSQPNLPVTGGNYSVTDTVALNDVINTRETAISIGWVGAAVISFVLALKVLKKLAII